MIGLVQGSGDKKREKKSLYLISVFTTMITFSALVSVNIGGVPINWPGREGDNSSPVRKRERERERGGGGVRCNTL